MAIRNPAEQIHDFPALPAWMHGGGSGTDPDGTGKKSLIFMDLHLHNSTVRGIMSAAFKHGGQLWS